MDDRCRAGENPHDGPPPLPPTVEASPLSNAIVRVARLHRLLAGQALRRVGLHLGQELVMMQLWDRGPQRQVDLVELLGSDAATIARTVKRLECAGFVRRRRDPSDKRAHIVEATTASLALRRQVEQAWSDLEDQVTTTLSAQDQQNALAVLESIEQSLTSANTRQAEA